MNLYYIRTLPQDWDTLIALGIQLGAIEQNEGVVKATLGGAWDYIGEIPTPTGNTIQGEDGIEYPETTPVADENGTPYLHANLITPLALGEVAQQMAQDNPEIAEGLSQLGRFFLLDEVGNARLPSQPYRVFAN